MQKIERLFSGPIGEEYEKLKLICPAAALMSRKVAEFVSSLPVEPLQAFEIGAGTGITTSALLNATESMSLVSIDNEPTMLNQARQNLAEHLDSGRLEFIETDALSGLKALPDVSLDLIASGYTLHNFLNGYRQEVLSEIYRTLKPGGIFVNGDRYALDDTLEHTRLIQDEVKGYFKVFNEIKRHDLLEQWIVHLFSDESEDHVMRTQPAFDALQRIGFEGIEFRFREGVSALLTAVKPG